MTLIQIRGLGYFYVKTEGEKTMTNKIDETKKRIPAKRIDIVSLELYKLELCKEGSILYENRRISGPIDSVEILNQFLLNNDREKMVVMSLNTKNEPTNISVVSIGSLNAAICHPREIFKIAVKSNANAIILGHSHPSGNPKPSNEDISITNRLKEAGEIIGIKLLDHLIIGGKDKYVSFKEKGLL